MQRIAIIDLGSNSVRLVVVRIYNNFNQLIYTQKSPLRLAQRMNKKGEISKEATEDIIDAIKKFSHMCGLFQTKTILAVATAAMRSAKNGQAIIEKIQAETGIEVQIISGKQEAYYSYLGAVNSLAVKDAVLFDLGGGSLEMILVKNRQIEHLASINIGTTTMTEKFKTADKMGAKEFKALTDYVTEALNKYFPWLKDCKLPVVGIGGTVRNLAKMHQRRVNYPYPKLHNYQMQVSQFKEIFSFLRATNYEERKKISGLTADRADIILAGATIINTLFIASKSKDFIISGCGLREGVFFDHHLKSQGKPPVLEDILDDSIHNLLTFTLGNNVHSHKVAQMAEQMFTAWQPLHKLDENALKILHIAANLHDIGISINYYAHPRHSAYLIENAPLMGLTHREQIMAALVANWHNNISMKSLKNKLYKELLSEQDVFVAKKLALFLAMAENLDFTETNAIKQIKAGILKDGRAVLNLASEDPLGIELGELQNNVTWFKKEFKTELVIREIRD